MAAGPRVIRLGGPADAAGWGRASRALLRDQVPPQDLRWAVEGEAEAGLFDDGAAAAEPSPLDGPTAAVAVPPRFLDLAPHALLHADPRRHALLYRLAWRLQREPGLRHDPLDADWVAAEALAKAVRRDLHKMRAFLRFHEQPGDGPGEPSRFVAWFEPQHHIVEANAPFFARRFASMRWAILTPLRSVAWDGERLAFGAGARREDAPAEDAQHALWRTYYASIFNPARLKLQAMQREMPRRYWPLLPEARLIAPLAAEATRRMQTMIDQPPTVTRRRLPAMAATAPAAPVAGLDALRRQAAGCTACPLGARATQTVFSEGSADALAVLVGEQPGDQEDLQGRPFVGPAGRLLDRVLAELGLPRERLYLTNAVKHFGHELRGQRRIHKTPGQRELLACQGWLQQELAALPADRPLVALGGTAARALLGRPVAVLRERGQWLTRTDGRRVLVTLHPAALLRLPAGEQAAAFEQWLDDLRSLPAQVGQGASPAVRTGSQRAHSSAQASPSAQPPSTSLGQ
ncbi:UdgX family uracil-DNA binding protein [Aquabacterium sp. J223]|uniref:UdgX family uracil-DNA binding protein n=1 Tax=Aquabacterium sp. J223 TaxID=2898431 RepID=UPI0021AE1226|nr:UdgX family uracil-DNA binding protein [Aquabacterium sp. J223]UUX96205.1 UdgX family uracil-DNA binding protein [Aquabacterium sp. J223]